MPRNTPMRMPTGLELKYESATYPKPPPTIRAATSSTPIRMAIERPFRNASGSSAIVHTRRKTARQLNRIDEVSQGCRMHCWDRHGRVKMPERRAPHGVSNLTRILPKGFPAHPAGDCPAPPGLFDVRALRAPGGGHGLPRAAGEWPETRWCSRTAVLDHRRRSRVPVSLHRVSRGLVRTRRDMDRPCRRSPGGVPGSPHSHGRPPPFWVPSILWGAVGYFSYDVARWFERLPHPPPDNLGLPDLELAFLDLVAAAGHDQQALWLTFCPFGGAVSKECREDTH